MGKKKKSTGFRATMFSLKGVLKIVVYLIILVVIINICKGAFSFGYKVFHQEPIASGTGQDVVVEIPVGASAGDIGELLEDNGLIEDGKLFVLQELLSNYHDKLQSGTFTLNTSQTVDEMIRILGGGVLEEE